MDDKDERRLQWSVDRFFYSVFLVCGYVLLVSLGKLIVFEVLPKVPQKVWLQIYWWIAGALFALYVVPIIRKWYNRDC